MYKNTLRAVTQKEIQNVAISFNMETKAYVSFYLQNVLTLKQFTRSNTIKYIPN